MRLSKSEKKLLKNLLNGYLTKKIPDDKKARIRVYALYAKVDRCDEE